MSTGTTFNKITTNVFKGIADVVVPEESYQYWTQNFYYVEDIDGDGKSDFIAVGNGEENGTNPPNPVKFFIAYSNGSINSNTDPFTLNTIQPVGNVDNYSFDNNYFTFGDFNGDGTTDILYDNGSTPIYNNDDVSTPYSQIYNINNGKVQNYIQTVTNGFGLNTNFTYSPITNNSIYTKGTSATYPVMDYQGPMYVVSSHYGYDIPGTPDVTNFTYSTGQTQLQGKGFLGFQQVNSTNPVHNLSTMSIYGYDQTYFHVTLNQKIVNSIVSSGVTSNANQISQIDYTTTLLTNSNIIYHMWAM